MNSKFVVAGAVMVVGLYKNNQLISMSYVSNIAIKSVVTKTMETVIQILTNRTGCEVRVFIWDNLSNKNITTTVYTLPQS